MSLKAVAKFSVCTEPLTDDGVTADVSLYVPKGPPTDYVCFSGTAKNLPFDLDAIPEKGGQGMACSDGNGCGVHVHSGNGCEPENQGGHWYEVGSGLDPWVFTSFSATSGAGEAIFSECVPVGYDLASDPSLLEGKTFIVHSDDGSRVSCGIIEKGKKGGCNPKKKKKKNNKKKKKKKNMALRK